MATAAENHQPGHLACIMALEPGQSYALAHKLPLGGATPQAVNDEIERLRNVAQPAAYRAKAKTGAKYTIEGGDFLTRSRDLVLTVVVTREP